MCPCSIMLSLRSMQVLDQRCVSYRRLLCDFLKDMDRMQRQMAQQVLTQFQENPDAWQRVPKVLEESSHPQAKASHHFISPRMILMDVYILVSRFADS
jgi:hypothetical protein